MLSLTLFAMISHTVFFYNLIILPLSFFSSTIINVKFYFTLHYKKIVIFNGYFRAPFFTFVYIVHVFNGNIYTNVKNGARKIIQCKAQGCKLFFIKVKEIIHILILYR